MFYNKLEKCQIHAVQMFTRNIFTSIVQALWLKNGFIHLTPPTSASELRNGEPSSLVERMSKTVYHALNRSRVRDKCLSCRQIDDKIHDKKYIKDFFFHRAMLRHKKKRYDKPHTELIHLHNTDPNAIQLI